MKFTIPRWFQPPKGKSKPPTVAELDALLQEADEDCARTGVGVERVSAALAKLGEAVVRESGPRNSQRLTVDWDLLPDEVRAEIEAES